jgi:hypothetical protein
MKRLTILVTLCVIALFIVGCGGGSDQPTMKISPYLGGTLGILGHFEPVGVKGESGMNEIYDDESFPVDIRIENKGEFEIPTGGLKVTLKGINPADFGYNDADLIQTNADSVLAADEFLPEGGEAYVSFGTAQYSVVGQFYDVNLFATLEYYYETDVAVPEACFKGDFKDDGLCKVEEGKKAFTSGGPITVTKVEESRAGSKNIFLKFYVSNVGSGKAKASDADEFSPVYDEIQFEVAETTPGLTCTSRGSAGIARLTDGQAVITCKSADLAKGDLFKKQVDLKLKYFYQSTIEDMFRIKESYEE